LVVKFPQRNKVETHVSDIMLNEFSGMMLEKIATIVWQQVRVIVSSDIYVLFCMMIVSRLLISERK
jgi:hypothetical protein